MSFEAGGCNDHSAPAYSAREDDVALAAEVDLDSLVTALFEADFENYLTEEYLDDLKQGMKLGGGNPIASMMRAVLTTFIHGFYKGLMWEDWRKKNEKEPIK